MVLYSAFCSSSKDNMLELDGENEMNIYLPALSDENVLAPLPTKKDVYISALSLRPEIEASKLNVEASELGIGIAKSSYLPKSALARESERCKP